MQCTHTQHQSNTNNPARGPHLALVCRPASPAPYSNKNEWAGKKRESWRAHVNTFLLSNSGVVGKQIRGSSWKSRNLVLERKLGDTSAKRISGQALECKEVSSEANDVRRSHRSAGDGVCTAVVPGAKDLHTWSEDVDAGTEVGERGPGVVLVTGADCAGCGLRRRRVVGGIGVTIAGGYTEEEA